MSNFKRSERERVSRNVEALIEGSKLLLVVDLMDVGPLSNAGNTRVVGSTGGFVDIEGQDGITVQLYVGKRLSKDERELARAAAKPRLVPQGPRVSA